MLVYPNRVELAIGLEVLIKIFTVNHHTGKRSQKGTDSKDLRTRTIILNKLGHGIFWLGGVGFQKFRNIQKHHLRLPTRVA